MNLDVNMEEANKNQGIFAKMGEGRVLFCVVNGPPPALPSRRDTGTEAGPAPRRLTACTLSWTCPWPAPPSNRNSRARPSTVRCSAAPFRTPPTRKCSWHWSMAGEAGKDQRRSSASEDASTRLRLTSFGGVVNAECGNNTKKRMFPFLTFARASRFQRFAQRHRLPVGPNGTHSHFGIANQQGAVHFRSEFPLAVPFCPNISTCRSPSLLGTRTNFDLSEWLCKEESSKL